MKRIGTLLGIALLVFATSASAQMTPTKRTTADGRPLASSLPTPSNARAQARALAFDELGNHLGRRIVLTTIYGDQREGRIDSVAGSTLRLHISAGTGFAVTNFERAKIRSILLLP